MRFIGNFDRTILGIRGRRARYNLDAFQLDTEARLLRVTDGHMAACFPVEVTQDDVSGLIPRQAIRAILTRKCQERRTHLVCAATLCSLVNETSGLRTTWSRPDPASYPNVMNVMPRFEGERHVAIDAAKLLRLANALGGLGFVNLWIGKADQAVLVTPERGAAYGCLMPLKITGMAPSLPPRPAPPQEAATPIAIDEVTAKQ